MGKLVNWWLVYEMILLKEEKISTVYSYFKISFLQTVQPGLSLENSIKI